MARRWPAFLGRLAAFALVLAGCGSAPSASERSAPARCDVGARPDYFVPSDPDRPLALLGCARLGVSGKKVEFSGHPDRIDGERHTCISPAYSGRGQRGFFIPSICFDPPLARFAVRDAAQPRQGVRGYAFVIWGTTRASTSGVVARFDAGTARAAVFEVHSKLARRFGEPPFGLFVVELPLTAACGPVTLRADGSDALQRIARRPRLCGR